MIRSSAQQAGPEIHQTWQPWHNSPAERLRWQRRPLGHFSAPFALNPIWSYLSWLNLQLQCKHHVHHVHKAPIDDHAEGDDGSTFQSRINPACAGPADQLLVSLFGLCLQEWPCGPRVLTNPAIVYPATGFDEPGSATRSTPWRSHWRFPWSCLEIAHNAVFRGVEARLKICGRAFPGKGVDESCR